MKEISDFEIKRLSLLIVEKLYEEFSPETVDEDGVYDKTFENMVKVDTYEVDFKYKYSYRDWLRDKYGDGIKCERKFLQLEEFELTIIDPATEDFINISKEYISLIGKTFFEKIKYYYS